MSEHEAELIKGWLRLAIRVLSGLTLVAIGLGVALRASYPLIPRIVGLVVFTAALTWLSKTRTGAEDE